MLRQLDQAVELKEKMVDYLNFSHILLAVSTFFYLGILIRGNDVSSTHIVIIISLTFTFIASAYFFKSLSLKYKKKLIEIEDNPNYYQH